MKTNSINHQYPSFTIHKRIIVQNNPRCVYSMSLRKWEVCMQMHSASPWEQQWQRSIYLFSRKRITKHSIEGKPQNIKRLTDTESMGYQTNQIVCNLWWFWSPYSSIRLSFPSFSKVSAHFRDIIWQIDRLIRDQDIIPQKIIGLH